MTRKEIVIPFFLFLSFSTVSLAAYNVVNFGAKADGKTDSAQPFLRTWAKACSSSKPSLINIPRGSFYVSRAVFLGPCKSPAIRIVIKGTILASSGYSTNSLKWLHFKNVQNLGIYGGIFDGRGKSLWNCKMAGRSCPNGAISLTVSNSNKVVISGVTSWNSKQVHISIQNSMDVTIKNAKIIAPKESPNTDGVHIQMSNGVKVLGSVIRTGDDCIAIKDGVRNLLVEQIACGPGHGISIGSLAEREREVGVQNIIVKSVVFTGTQNGVRIKTWSRHSTGFVKGVTFHNAVMRNVQNPIIIDQNYCPSGKNCPNQHSGIKISEVSFKNIRGSSATPVAVKFDCSKKNHCTGIQLKNINLTYGKIKARSFCKNAHGKASGSVIPTSCL